MIDSTSTSSNIQEVVDNNSNHYRSIVMDVTRINQDYLGEDSHDISYEESNIYVTRFF
jgi:hypothetical protein